MCVQAVYVALLFFSVLLWDVFKCLRGSRRSSVVGHELWKRRLKKKKGPTWKDGGEHNYSKAIFCPWKLEMKAFMEVWWICRISLLPSDLICSAANSASGPVWFLHRLSVITEQHSSLTFSHDERYASVTTSVGSRLSSSGLASTPHATFIHSEITPSRPEGVFRA